MRDHIAKGHGNEIGFGATTVIIENAGKGVQFAGPLPAAIQNYTAYAAASNLQMPATTRPAFLDYSGDFGDAVDAADRRASI